MHIAICTQGTRGDVQPYVAIARGLARAGFDVSVVSHEEFRGLVEENGLAFRPLRPSMRELLDSELGRRWLESGDNPFRYMRFAKQLFAEPAKQWLRSMTEAISDADLVICYPLAGMNCMHLVEKRDIPMLVLPPWPGVETAECAQPSMKVPEILNRASWRFIAWFFCRPFAEDHHAFRRELGLQPLRHSILRSMWERRMPHWHIISPLLFPAPGDWPSEAEVIGYAFLDRPDYEPPDALASFLDAGEPPIAIGFGSMMSNRPDQLAEMLLRALRATDQRAVFIGGWSDADLKLDDERVFAVEDVPHDWLYPRCKAVVHHGGAGTTAASLRAGKPTAVLSFFADQQFWGRQVERIGAGPAPIERRELTQVALDRSFRALLDDAALTRGAERAAQRIAREDGVAEVVGRVSAMTS